MMMMMGESLAQLGSVIGTVMFVWAMFQQYFPYQLQLKIEKYGQKLVNWVFPYIQITFHEYPNDGFKRSKAYAAIESYLGANSTMRVKRLKGDVVKDSQSLVLSMGDYEEIIDEFEGIKLCWVFSKKLPNSQTITFYPGEDERRHYKLSFHQRHHDMVTGYYLNHVLEEGKKISIRNRQRKLYTNSRGENWHGHNTMWSHIVFEHPATFETLAMEPKKKQDIINDLVTCSKAKDYYAKIGKACKRGYLLYGPPGTGKSTMIAAMANFMQYDVYDLELTAVKNNTELRKLLIDTSSKSIIVIEDIDCSLDLTGQRKEKNEEDGKEKGKDSVVFTKAKANQDENKSKKLDPALIRRERMDKHIELSYCCFEAFKVLAKNYLDLDWNDLFATISPLLEETNMTPADVAENLMPKSAEEDADTCLRNFIKALETSKKEARLKAEEEERLKAEKEHEEDDQNCTEVKDKASASAQDGNENGFSNGDDSETE
ncbi:unnamed protein product [Ilex paraguariensis]|uniref:AAA+ ATPase domain-containing protein n=1 Tax=Ilex paraguariensis TaxID=185542 RepID=A0ABC8UHP8_9AQUA